jgi:hypothetical protein
MCTAVNNLKRAILFTTAVVYYLVNGILMFSLSLLIFEPLHYLCPKVKVCIIIFIYSNFHDLQILIWNAAVYMHYTSLLRAFIFQKKLPKHLFMPKTLLYIYSALSIMKKKTLHYSIESVWSFFVGHNYVFIIQSFVVLW